MRIVLSNDVSKYFKIPSVIIKLTKLTQICSSAHSMEEVYIPPLRKLVADNLPQCR